MFATTPFKRGAGNGNDAGLAARSLGKPAAAFPGRVATDADMAIAVDRQQTRLALPMSANDSSMTVVDPTVIAAWSLLSIDAEIVQATGPATGNVVPVSRGFDGTTPALHLASATVSGFIDAYHHNRVVSEIEAIENALGPNLSRIPAVPFLVNSNFDFPAQSPGGSLTTGNNVITLSPVPQGVNGTDTNHYLYISGGTGAAEAALITGGSAVAGAASGTVIVNCANTHSGAWTIKSATAGIQEAIVSIPNGGLIYIIAGTSNTYATITVSRQYIELVGATMGSRIQANFTSGQIFYFTASGNGSGGPYGFGNSISSLYLKGPASPGTLTGIEVRGQLAMRIVDMNIEQVATGVYVNDTTGAVTSAVWMHRNYINPVAGSSTTAIHLNGGADHFLVNNHLTSSPVSPAAAGIWVEHSLGSKIIANEVYGFTNALLLQPGSGQNNAAIESINNWYDSAAGDGMKFNPQGTGTISEIQSVADRIGASAGNGVTIYGTASNVLTVVFSNTLVCFNHGQGIYYGGGMDVEFNGCHVYGNSEASPGTNHGLFVAIGASNLRVHGGTYAQAAGRPGTAPPNSQGYGILVSPGASDYIVIEGAVVTPNLTGSMTVGALTGTHNVIRGNVGYNPVGQAAITVGASPFTYRAGPSPEVVYIRGGTVTDIKVGATSVASASPAQMALGPNASITVTYSAAPTMVKDVQ